MRHTKKSIDRRGRRLDGETPLLCTPLVGRTHKRLLAEASRVLAQKPDALEWRVDHYESIGDTADVIETLRALRALAGEMPIIFTRRWSQEGGEPIPIGDEQVLDLYDAVAASRLADFVDFEMLNDPAHVRRVRESTRAHRVRLILSYHNFSFTPGREYLVDRFLEAERLGADVAAVFVMPRDREDVLTLLSATSRADAKTHIPLIGVSMGPLGAVSRMIGGLFGSGLMYAVGESASAPGQVPIGHLKTMFDIIRKARGGEMA